MGIKGQPDAGCPSRKGEEGLLDLLSLSGDRLGGGAGIDGIGDIGDTADAGGTLGRRDGDELGVDTVLREGNVVDIGLLDDAMTCEILHAFLCIRESLVPGFGPLDGFPCGFVTDKLASSLFFQRSLRERGEEAATGLGLVGIDETENEAGVSAGVTFVGREDADISAGGAVELKEVPEGFRIELHDTEI